MLTVVTWYWRQPGRAVIPPWTVSRLRAGVARHYRGDHRFVCVTNCPAGISREVEIVPDREDWAELPSPVGPLSSAPSCYRRLRLFAPDAGDVFGPRVVSLDLDLEIVGDLGPLWDRPEDVVLWRDPNPRGRYNPSILLLRTGSRPEVWSTFEGAASVRRARAAGMLACDQAWISYALGPDVPTWSRADGVLSYKCDLAHVRPGRASRLPADTRVVVFHGEPRPWSTDLVLPWAAPGPTADHADRVYV